MTKDKFLRGAMILTLAGLMVKIIGSVNRILLSRLLGGEGIGLYQMAYPVYLLMLSVSSPPSSLDNSILLTEPMILTISQASVNIMAPRKNLSLVIPSSFP